MWFRGRAVAAAAVLWLAASGCTEGAPEVSAEEETRAQLGRLAEAPPAQLLRRVLEAYDGTVVRTRITPPAPEGEEPRPYTRVAGPDAWRVDVPHPDAAAGDGMTTALVAGKDLCFDREFRSVVRANVASSYALIEFDRAQPWTCTERDFGVNRLATFRYTREDPRWRLEHLTTEPADELVAEVEDVDGEPLLHVRTTGVTYDGPLDPQRPVYDLWVDADHLPVRMETDGLLWEFDYAEGLEQELAAPPAGKRGSYGWSHGPGMGTAKACYLAPAHCADLEFPLDWGDGRRS